MESFKFTGIGDGLSNRGGESGWREFDGRTTSYANPNDGIRTPQEPAIRDHQRRADDARNAADRDAKNAVLGGLGTTLVGGATKNPYAIGTGGVATAAWTANSIKEMRSSIRDQKIADFYKSSEMDFLKSKSK